jgi:hypothetical protein
MMKREVVKRSAVLAACCIVLLVTSPATAASLLSPPGNGIPLVSKSKPVKQLNSEMMITLADNHFFVKGAHGLTINKNHREKLYESSYAIPELNFDIRCKLSIEQGGIRISAGNITFVILPGRAEIHQDGKVIKVYENKGIMGVGIERGYDNIENKIGSVARVYSDGFASGIEVRMLFPAKISVIIIPNTVGRIGGWEWVRGTT